ncbi:hypothetical protein KKF34_07280 [Myxococcota bacterium]|nr:hypothetical protein [Myxococcota bacterium]MBU1382340.1 hypothetical protein [Myxococcota bacterium]MBU1496661.1 hypothetical protein [Myxococcota bacterium]
MRNLKSFSKTDYIKIGKRFSSTDIQYEASIAAARWSRDIEVLSEFGFHQAKLDEFNQLRDEHTKLIEKRLEGVSGKKITRLAKNETLVNAWNWIHKVTAILVSFARSEEELAVRLKTIMPKDDRDLLSSISAMAVLLNEKKSSLPPESKVDLRLEESVTLCEILTAISGEVSNLSSQAVMDTAEIDLQDGKLYIIMRDLFEVGKKAIRNGFLYQNIKDYRFNMFTPLKYRPAPESPSVPS